jgi:hypothetical protein
VPESRGDIPAPKGYVLWAHTGLRKNRQLVQMNQLSLRKNRLKLETSGELPIILEESIEEYMSNE